MSYSVVYGMDRPYPHRIPIPVPSDDPNFLERWRNSVPTADTHWKLLNFDAQYQVYWIECIPPRHETLFYILELGKSYYWYIKGLREKKILNWQLPFLLPDRKSIKENPPPPQFIYGQTGLLKLCFRFWERQKDLQPFLDKFNAYYDNWDEDGQNADWFFVEYEDFDTGYGNDIIAVICNAWRPFTASMLFELGAQLLHASVTNFWNLPPPLPQGRGYTLTVKDITQVLNIYLSWPKGTPDRERMVTKLSTHLLKYKIIERSKEIEALSSQRPLLRRENIELDFLKKITAADNVDALQQIEAELSGTATDPQLIGQLKNYIAEKQAFIIGANGKFEN